MFNFLKTFFGSLSKPMPAIDSEWVQDRHNPFYLSMVMFEEKTVVLAVAERYVKVLIKYRGYSNKDKCKSYDIDSFYNHFITLEQAKQRLDRAGIKY